MDFKLMFKDVAWGARAHSPNRNVVSSFFGWILAEICLKCIIWETNFQKSPSDGEPPAPLNLRFWWPEVTWCGQILFFSSWLWRNQTSKKSVMTSWPTIMSPKNVTKFFHFPNQNFWLRQCYCFLEKVKNRTKTFWAKDFSIFSQI